MSVGGGNKGIILVQVCRPFFFSSNPSSFIYLNCEKGDPFINLPLKFATLYVPEFTKKRASRKDL